ncbi:MAG: glucokinase, partial [Pseudomonadota bacterium]
MTDLVADVGATHARFQLCDEDGLRGDPIILQTAGYAAVPDLLDDVLRSPGMQDVALGRVLFAVAGPQAPAGGITVTNTGLLFDAAQCSAHLEVDVRLENDFFALAHGVPLFTELTQLGGASARPGNKALLGPGSGLGMATIVPVGPGGP